MLNFFKLLEELETLFLIHKQLKAMSTISIQKQQNYPAQLFIPQSSPKDDLKWLQEIETYITNQMANPELTILSMAMEFFLSERQFYRKLNRLTGMTPNIFLREIRLKKAYELLISGKYNKVKEVAAIIGYKRVDYFSNLFAAKYKFKPLELLISYT